MKINRFSGGIEEPAVLILVGVPVDVCSVRCELLSLVVYCSLGWIGVAFVYALLVGAFVTGNVAEVLYGRPAEGTLVVALLYPAFEALCVEVVPWVAFQLRHHV